MICRKYPLLAERFEVELASKRSKGKTKKGKKTKTAADELECLDDLLCKINNIDLNENTKIMAEHSNNDCNDKDISRKTSQKVTLAAGPYFEPHQHSWSYDLEDNSLAGPMTNYTRTSESRKFYADDKIENVDSKEAESRADFVCIKPDQLLGTNRCENASPIIVNSSYTLPNLNFGAVGSSSSPAENEKTILNLADITVDQSFGSDFEAIDDLLTDSFVASLQNITPVHGSSCHYSTEISPSFKLFSTNTNHGNSDVLFETTMMNQSENVLLTSFGDKKFIDSPQELDMNPTGVKRQEFSTAIDGLDDENSICEPKAKFSVAASDTPSCRETTSLTSRLLKRFQTENRTNMADKLRSISGDKELVYSDKEINKSTEPPTYRAKQNKRFVTEVHDMNGPLTNISNIGKEMKSSKAKPKDVIVLD
ncbi:Hypothetical predicted protein [Paramuricea clavata]|uniref:Uncharacterized protein n=1 Tax=Paramuricea clavata TaxID=317549 RepID=A0A6S7HV46_PARCT|nr:Hypothetical predicted protein [Paramuricea clavata]